MILVYELHFSWEICIFHFQKVTLSISYKGAGSWGGVGGGGGGAILSTSNICVPGKVKLSRYAMYVLRGERTYSSYSFLTLALGEGELQHHAMTALYPREKIPSNNWIKGWVDLRAGLHTEVRGLILTELPQLPFQEKVKSNILGQC
jgi:hypothetical protein